LGRSRFTAGLGGFNKGDETMDLKSINVISANLKLEGEIIVLIDSMEYKILSDSHLNATPLSGTFEDYGYSGKVVVCNKELWLCGGLEVATFKLRTITA
jgi:hypothetical protein